MERSEIHRIKPSDHLMLEDSRRERLQTVYNQRVSRSQELPTKFQAATAPKRFMSGDRIKPNSNSRARSNSYSFARRPSGPITHPKTNGGLSLPPPPVKNGQRNPAYDMLSKTNKKSLSRSQQSSKVYAEIQPKRASSKKKNTPPPLPASSPPTNGTKQNKTARSQKETLKPGTNSKKGKGSQPPKPGPITSQKTTTGQQPLRSGPAPPRPSQPIRPGFPPPRPGPPPANTGRLPPNTGRLPPNTDHLPPNTGRLPPNTGRPPPYTGRLPPNTGPPPRGGQPPPLYGSPFPPTGFRPTQNGPYPTGPGVRPSGPQGPQTRAPQTDKNGKMIQPWSTGGGPQQQKARSGPSKPPAQKHIPKKSVSRQRKKKKGSPCCCIFGIILCMLILGGGAAAVVLYTMGEFDGATPAENTDDTSTTTPEKPKLSGFYCPEEVTGRVGAPAAVRCDMYSATLPSSGDVLAIAQLFKKLPVTGEYTRKFNLEMPRGLDAINISGHNTMLWVNRTTEDQLTIVYDIVDLTCYEGGTYNMMLVIGQNEYRHKVVVAPIGQMSVALESPLSGIPEDQGVELVCRVRMGCTVRNIIWIHGNLQTLQVSTVTTGLETPRPSYSVDMFYTGESTLTVTATDVQNLTYYKCMIEETTRYYDIYNIIVINNEQCEGQEDGYVSHPFKCAFYADCFNSTVTSVRTCDDEGDDMVFNPDERVCMNATDYKCVDPFVSF